MKVAIVGGIYGKSSEYREKFRITPETTLEDGLRQRGIEVSTFSHYAPIDCCDFDVVHVHHLSWGAIRVATDRSQCAFVFTTHNAQYMSESLPFSARKAFHFVFGRADAVVALSSIEKTFQEQHYPLRGAINRVIPNGIPSTQYEMRRVNSKGLKVPWQILYVGQLNKIKRVDLLLHAVNRAPFPIKVKLAYQNSELEADLRLLASKLGIADAVHFVGFKKPEELCRLYNESDLFVLPSSGEALPSVITEAMLCGTPIIATNVGGICEQLGRFGRIVAPNNLEELISAIEEVLTHYDQFSNQASQMSEFARQNFSIDSMVDRHIDLYRQLSTPTARRRNQVFLRTASALARLGLMFWSKARSKVIA